VLERDVEGDVLEQPIELAQRKGTHIHPPVAEEKATPGQSIYRYSTKH
jgi:hypothetical protein